MLLVLALHEFRGADNCNFSCRLLLASPVHVDLFRMVEETFAARIIAGKSR